MGGGDTLRLWPVSVWTTLYAPGGPKRYTAKFVSALPLQKHKMCVQILNDQTSFQCKENPFGKHNEGHSCNYDVYDGCCFIERA
jgi:hypothetical protein